MLMLNGLVMMSLVDFELNPHQSGVLMQCQNYDGLNGHQNGEDLQEKSMKKNLTHDILTVMSDRVKVKFKVRPDVYETETG